MDKEILNNIETPLNVNDIIDIVKRQKGKIFFPFIIIVLLAISFAVLLPAKYISVATILVEEQEIPADFLKTTITRYIDQQLQVIKQRTMSRTKLKEIIDQNKLYKNLVNNVSFEDIIDKMRGDIEMDIINAEVIDKKTGRAGQATIAFTLSYEGKDPYTVQKVTNSLASLFLEENFKSRTEHTKNVSTFFENERDIYQEKLTLLNKKIVLLKEKHMGELPESARMTEQMIERLERELISIDNTLKSLMDRKVFAEGQLAIAMSAENGVPLTNSERLASLKLERVLLESKFSERYPDVKRLTHKIKLLESVVENEKTFEENIKSINILKKEYDMLIKVKRKKNKNRLKQIKNSINSFEEKNRKLQENIFYEMKDKKNENISSFLSIKVQIAQTEIEIKAQKKLWKTTKGKIDEYQKRLERMPQVELEYNTLLMEYNNTETKFQNLEIKLMEAKMSENVEKDQKGETFVIIDPPVLPEKPHKPNRVAIILIGFILAIGSGTACGFVFESMDQTFKSVKDVLRFSNIPIVGEIGVIVTAEDITRKKIKIAAIFIVFVCIVAITLILFNNYIMPLDIFWIDLMRIINNRMLIFMN